MPNLAIEKEKVDIKDEKGSLKVFDDFNTGSGKPVKRSFCGNCGRYVTLAALFVLYFFR